MNDQDRARALRGRPAPRKVSLAGVPALAATVAVLIVAANVASTTEARRASWYAREGARRARAGDHDAALVCYQWLIQNWNDTPELRVAQAKVYQDRGDLAGALSVLERLAPADRPGYTPAHLAAARILLNGGDVSERTRRAAEIHLRRALDAPGTVDAEAAGLLGRVYLATGRFKEAEPLLADAAEREPELLLLLVRLARDRGDAARARAHAERARRVFRARAESRLDDPEARVYWAAAEVALADYPAAVKVLDDGRRLSPDPRYARSLAEVYWAWALDAPAPAPDRVARLVRGLDADPENRGVLRLLTDVIERRGDEADVLRSTLLGRLSGGEAAATTYSLLGYDAYARGRPDEARSYWELAFRLEPSAPVLANNVAWALAHAEAPDLPRALELVGRALARAPDDPNFRATRGEVFAKLGRWAEAVADLKPALAAIPDRPEAHLALAEAYDHLGLPDPASAHRRAAARLSPRR